MYKTVSYPCLKFFSKMKIIFMLIYSEMNAIYHVDCKILIYSHEFSMKSKTWRDDVHDYVVEN